MRKERCGMYSYCLILDKIQMMVLFVDYYLLGYKAVWSVECEPMFRRKISHPSSESRNKPSKKRRLTFNGLHGVISQKI
jgi:hypothetical protein